MPTCSFLNGLYKSYKVTDKLLVALKGLQLLHVQTDTTNQCQGNKKVAKRKMSYLVDGWV